MAKKIAYSAIILIFLALAGGFWLAAKRAEEQVLPEPIQVELPKSKENSVEIVSEKLEAVPAPAPIPAELPKKILIPMPFTTQAPFANWDARHEEACEEAALLMVAYFIKGKSLNPQLAEDELQKMIDFQIRNYGSFEDSDAAGIVQLAKDYFLINNLKAIYDFPKERIKEELAKGKPVIILAAGRDLGNPNFTGLGPPYHALVAKGYDGDTIITNDPGTRKGENYRYDIDVLYGAIHDFPGSKDRIREGRKAMIVVE